MKIRNGFISNSSTTSFIIGINGDNEGDLRHELQKAFFNAFLYTNINSSPNKIISKIALELIEAIISSTTQYTLEEYIETYKWKGVNLNNDEKELFEKYKTIFVGNFYPDDGYLNRILSESDLTIKSENITMYYYKN